MKKALVTLFIIKCFVVYSRSPSQMPYRVFELQKISPFTANELKIFKEQKIKKLRVVIVNFEMWEVYYFNEEGTLTHSEIAYKKKKKEIISTRTSYHYDNYGHLLSCYSKGMEMITYDSLTYDHIGRITSLYSTQKYIIGKKEFQETYVTQDLQLLSSSEKNRVLVDRLDTNNITQYTLDNNNEIVRVESEKSIDSVSVEYRSSSNHIKKYWYKDILQVVWRLGAERIYKDSLRIEEKNWRMDYVPGEAYDHEVTKNKFFYDDQRRLVMEQLGNVYNEGPKIIVYVYDGLGLLSEMVDVSEGRMGVFLLCAQLLV